MTRSLLLLFAVFLAIGAVDGTARAEEVVVAGQRLVLAPPSGYCTLNKDRPEEAELINRLREGNTGRNEVLLAYLRCDERDRWREGGERALLHHGHFLAALTNGKVEALDGTTRRGLIAQLERAIPKLDRNLLKDAVNEAVASAKLGRLAQFKQGIAGKDDNALYIANLGLFESNGKEAAVAGMTSITLLKGLLVSANLYRPFENDASFDALLAEARETAVAMVTANPDSFIPATPSPPKRSWLAWGGLAAGLGLLGIAVYLRRRTRT